jgi:hypothetical protein
MARQGHTHLSRLCQRLLVAAATAIAITASAAAAVGTPAHAATPPHKGGCTPYLSVIPGGELTLDSPEPVGIFDVSWAGSSSGWSPPGSLRIAATAFENGIPLGSVTGVKDNTSVSTPPGGPVPIVTTDAIISVTVTAYGPAGKVTCSTEQPVAEPGPLLANDESTDNTNGKGHSPAGSPLDTWTSPSAATTSQATWLSGFLPVAH